MRTRIEALTRRVAELEHQRDHAHVVAQQIAQDRVVLSSRLLAMVVIVESAVLWAKDPTDWALADLKRTVEKYGDRAQVAVKEHNQNPPQGTTRDDVVAIFDGIARRTNAARQARLRWDVAEAVEDERTV